MASSVVRATVRAVSKRKIQATRAALTLVSAADAGGARLAPAGPRLLTAARTAPRGRAGLRGRWCAAAGDSGA